MLSQGQKLIVVGVVMLIEEKHLNVYMHLVIRVIKAWTS